MSETITVRGFVATDPEHKTYEQGLGVTSFRLASTPRRFDRQANAWVDGDTNWFSVSCFRELAANAACSVHKGDPILITGRLRVQSFTRRDGTPGSAVSIEAESLGHDLMFGTATFGRRMRGGGPNAASSGDEGAGQLASDEDAPGVEGNTVGPNEESPEHVDADGVLLDDDATDASSAWEDSTPQTAGVA